MAEKMTEAEIDQFLVRAAKLEIVFYTGTDTEEMHRAIQRDDLQGRLLLFHAVRALRQVREEREGRERYWDGVRRLMIEAGAEHGDAEHLARSLIDQRDAYRRALEAIAQEGVGAVAEPPTYAQEHYAGVIEDIHTLARAALAAGKKGAK